MGDIISTHSSQELVPFSTFYEQNYQSVLSYINRKIGNFHDAEDLAGEAFLYCYHHYSAYDPQKSSLSTWLYLVVNSRIKNYYRGKHIFQDISEMENQLFDEVNIVDHSLYLEQVRATLATALEALPERQRRIVIMRYFRDMSCKEIAEKLGLTSGNVRVQLSRALDKMEIKCRDLFD